MIVDVVLNAAGGLALFLLAMVMMTEGLKTFVGRGLKSFLQRCTARPIRGVFSGALVTALVQSSSAVTVATISFVNAGVLTLKQGLGVIFGSNVGTTLTGWLVSLVGVGLKIDALAMPILAFGVGLQFLAPRKRLQALGQALTGFGLFFLGLAVLKDAFSGLADSFGDSLVTVADGGGIILFIIGGFIATVLTQSSSAAIAIILVAASESVIGNHAAAAAIIGANIGTTSTAAFASLNATANARRLAAGHVAFNLITGVIALILLPVMLVITQQAGNALGLGGNGNDVAFLALFHTIFNVLGLALLFPFIGRLAHLLQGLFKTEDEDISRPRYLDKTVAQTPAMAVSALWRELQRMNAYHGETVQTALDSKHPQSKQIAKKSQAVFALGEAITEFMATLSMESMRREVSEELPNIMRAARYLEDASSHVPEIIKLVHDIDNLTQTGLQQSLRQVIDHAAAANAVFARAVHDQDHHDQGVIIMDRMQRAYQDAKSALLQAAASRDLSPEKADHLLDQLSHMRRMLEQAAKADRLLPTAEAVATDNGNATPEPTDTTPERLAANSPDA